VYLCSERFRNFVVGHGDLEYDPTCWWPSTAQNVETVGKVHGLVAGDCYMTLRLMEGQVLINEQGVCQILEEDLGKRKICMHCVTQSWR
jgi:hypothetical protein